MRKLWPLLALGCGAFFVLAVVTLPAQVVLSRFAALGVESAGVSGTVWNGRAQVLQVGGARVGSIEWDLQVLPLFTARLRADVKVKRVDGFAQTELTLAPSGHVRFEQLTASLPLGALPPNVLPGGWSGTLNLKLDELKLINGWPTEIEGTAEAVGMTGPANSPVNMGNYKVQFAAQPANAEALTGALTDAGGPLQIAGTLQLKPDRSYLIEGTIAARPDAPQGVVNAIQYLGVPDAQGLRPFSIAGTM